MDQFVIDVENCGVTSFHDTKTAVALAKRLGCSIRTMLRGKKVLVDGTEDPHELYAALESNNWPDGMTLHVYRRAAKAREPG